MTFYLIGMARQSGRIKTHFDKKSDLLKLKMKFVLIM